MRHVELKINVQKTKGILLDRKKCVSDFKLHINDKNLEQVDEFCNSGRMFTKDEKRMEKCGMQR